MPDIYKNIEQHNIGQKRKILIVFDGKLQYNINWEAAKISALSSAKINKYQYPTGVEILASNQKQIIE